MTHQSPLPFIQEEADKRGLPTTSVFDLNSIETWGRVRSVYDVPSQSDHRERLFTYGLVFGTRPARVLEIGFRFGGSSFLMMCALEDAGEGVLVSVDPSPESVLDFSRFGDRFTLIRGSSPQAIPSAIEALGGPVNLCFIDGNHAYDHVRADLQAIDPHMDANSYILLHDAGYPDVQRATDEYLTQQGSRVVDCGVVCPWTSPEGWGGLRLLRVVRRR